MSRSPITGWHKVPPPGVILLDDNRWFRPAEAQKWADESDEPTQELYRLPGTDAVWVLVDVQLFWLQLPCARQASETEAATFFLQNGHELPEELQAAAESLRLTPTKSGSGHVAPPPRPHQPSPGAKGASHSPDFRSVRWFGTVYAFTPVQAACVKAMWKAWEDGAPEVGQQTILTEADAESTRLTDVFKGHKAWRTMIVAGATRGAFMLAQPRR